MALLHISPLEDGLGFGARVGGVTWDNVKERDVQALIRQTFHDRGMMVFEDVEPSDRMLVALSNIIGPLQDIILPEVTRVDNDTMPGVVQFKNEPGDDNIFEIDGELLSGVLTWHFDACYNAKLNRGGVLRVVENPPEGGLTGFADGIELYNSISPALRAKIENIDIIYQTYFMFQYQRFGLPRGYRMVRTQEEADRVLEGCKHAPRSVHPAVWTNDRGQKILHAAPFQCAGILGNETPEGDALLEELFAEIHGKMKPYWHKWKATDMACWDNWRFIHAVNGNPPQYARCVRRTTIEGDYGHGYWEADAGARIAEPA